MRNANYQHDIRCRLEKRPYLVPIFSHASDIPRRVREYDPSFFVVFNTHNQKFEIHSLEYPADNTISCTIPYEDLDERTLQHIYVNDIRVHGMEIFRRLELAEEREQKRREREQKNLAIDFAKDSQSAFAKDAWIL